MMYGKNTFASTTFANIGQHRRLFYVLLYSTLLLSQNLIKKTSKMFASKIDMITTTTTINAIILKIKNLFSITYLKNKLTTIMKS